MAKCETKSQRECLTSSDNGEEVCKGVPRNDCTVETVKSVKRVPNTKCKTMEQPRTICGPRLCPLTEGEPVCEDRIKMVISVTLTCLSYLCMTAECCFDRL